MELKRLFVGLAALILGAVALPGAAWAQAPICGLTGSPATATTFDYDPFNPSGLGTTTITLNLQRINQPGGAKTDAVRFILKAQNATADGTTIVPISAAGAVNATGLGLNIFYNFAAPLPILTGTPTSGNRFLLVEFTGNNPASDTVQVTFNVTLPANLDLTASQNLAFDLIYTCTTTGGGPSQTGGGTIPNAVTFPIRVLSALQASWVGPDLDFGEVGDKTTVDVLGSPATYTRNGNIRVASSGPYTVTLSSQNDYRLTYPGGNVANANERLNYSLAFLGQLRSTGVGGNVNQTCDRASLAGRYLPILVTLLEGGNLKTPSPDYKDTLTVTFAPQVTPSVNVCGTP